MTVQMPKAFFDRTPEACLFVSVTGSIEYVNSATERLLGAESQGLVDQSLFLLIAPQQREQFVEYFQTSTLDTDLAFFEAQGTTRKGEHLDLSISVTPILGNNHTCVNKLVVMRDMTQHKATLRALKDREFKLNAIVNCSPSALSLKTPQGIYVLANPKLQQIHNLTEQQIVGKSDFDLYPQTVAQALRINDQIVLDNKCRYSTEEFIPVNGELRCFMSHLFPVLNEQGDIQYTGRISLDITEQKTAALQVKKFAQAIEQSPVSMLITDSNQNIEFVNHSFLKTTGYDIADVLGKRPGLLASGKTHPDVYQSLRDTLSKNQVWKGEFINRRKNGEEYHDSATISTIRQDDGHISHYVAVQQDITKFKLIQSQLKASEERFNLAMQGSSDGLWDWNIENNQIYWSPRWIEMLGYRANELTANFETWESLIHPEDHNNAVEMLRRSLDDREKTQFSGQFRLAHKNGHWVTVISRGLIVRNAQGHPVRMVGTHIDQTAIDALQVELKKAWYAAQSEADTSDHIAVKLDTLNRTIRSSLESLEKEMQLLEAVQEGLPLQPQTVHRLKEVVETLAHSLNDLNDFAELE